MKRLHRFYSWRCWRISINLVVIVNAIVLGAIAEAPEDSSFADWLEILDNAFLGLLVLDAVLCMAVKRSAVWRSGWDLFDISVTLVSVMPNLGMLSAFRVLRVIRVLRLISFSSHSREILAVMMSAMRNMTAAYIVLGVVFYSFVVITTDLFRDVDPPHYGTLGRSAAHLYTVMVSLGSGLEAEPVLTDHPWALPVFAAFVLIVSFGLMNMFIAVLVTAMSGLIEEEAMQEERARFDRLERKVDALVALLVARSQRSPGD